jgi:hypothetical protein
MTDSTLQAVTQLDAGATDPLHDLLRKGARELITKAVKPSHRGELMVRAYRRKRSANPIFLNGSVLACHRGGHSRDRACWRCSPA